MFGTTPQTAPAQTNVTSYGNFVTILQIQGRKVNILKTAGKAGFCKVYSPVLGDMVVIFGSSIIPKDATTVGTIATVPPDTEVTKISDKTFVIGTSNVAGEYTF